LFAKLTFLPTIVLEVSPDLLKVSLGFGPYLTLDSHFQYPPFASAASAYQSEYYYGSCTSPHMLEYQILGGLNYEYNISIWNKHIKSNSQDFLETSVISGCLLQQTSEQYTVSFLVAKSLTDLKQEVSVTRQLLIKDIINSIESVSEFQFPKIDLSGFGNLINVTLYLSDDQNYLSATELLSSINLNVKNTNSLLYSQDRYLTKYIVKDSNGNANPGNS
jgi:hypothetical protein